MTSMEARHSSGATLVRPAALLLDFGGVVVATTNRPGWQGEVAARVVQRLAAAGHGTKLDVGAVERDISAGAQADSRWKDAMSRPLEPAELTHRQFWEDFVAADWSPADRAVVVAAATELCHEMGTLRQDREIRDGMVELLEHATAIDLPVVIVSNALSGRVHREHLAQSGIAPHVRAQVYSDEIGIRKPHPGMILRGAAEAGTTADRCWYVGDNVDRDVLCGVRAGVGANILMEADSTWDLAYDLAIRPDALVPDPWGLLTLLEESLAGRVSRD